MDPTQPRASRRRFGLLVAAAALAVGVPARLDADDWPQWRHDARRTADSPANLADRLTLRWVRQYGPRTPAWEDPLNRDLMPFDTVFEPVVLGDTMFVGFNDADKLVALDIRTGRELWTFYADGPVRLAPAAWRDRVCVASDDGWLYCLEASDGTIAWQWRGAPAPRKALGNGRLISAWPARGGPVIRDGTVYFAASIWPFMGTFLHALDVATGTVLWTNDGTGAHYTKQPHAAPAFAGVAPQGALVATEKYLLVPGGRSIPAAFDRATGAFIYFPIAESGKGTGGSSVMATESEFFVHGRGRATRAYDLATGKKSDRIVDEPVLGKRHIYCTSEQPAAFAACTEAKTKLDAARYGATRTRCELDDAHALGDAEKIRRAETLHEAAEEKVRLAERVLAEADKRAAAARAAPVVQAWNADQSLSWEIEADGSGDLIRAGHRLYAAGSGAITAIEMPGADRRPSIARTLPVKGTVGRLLAARGMLFAVTREGSILAFGPDPGGALVPEAGGTVAPPPIATERARLILERTGARDGYAFVLGLGDGELVNALAAASRLHIIGVDPDAKRVDRLRRRLDAAGLYGTRVALLAADPAAFGAPPYVAELVVAEGTFAPRLGDPATLRAVYESVRPYGGSLWIAGNLAPQTARAAGLANARVESCAGATRILREGALPGAADWTHQYGDVANTVKSDDQILRLPVGLLWFGGNTHMDVLPRHGHGPTEQVVGGRLYIEGMDCLSARDVYTGRRLWKTTLPGLNTAGVYHDRTHLDDPLTTLYSQRHIPGANARGTNFVAAGHGVYVAVDHRCVVLDAVTGAITRAISMPAAPGAADAPAWGYIGLCDDVLLGGAGFVRFSRRLTSAGLDLLSGIGDRIASAGLVAFDRRTGRPLWRADARHGFLHNGIVAGGGRVYCLDRLPKSVAARAGHNAAPARIAAFDLRTGRLLWERDREIFGTWLAYSKERDLLLEAGAKASDRLRDEASGGMTVLRAGDGTELWSNPTLEYTGPCILHRDVIITTPTSYKASAGAYNLLDGTPHTIVNPLTGEPQPWRVYRTYGCNTPVASEHVMTFRSGAAGFYDLRTHAGTGNMGGFKSGCSANLIVANGVLNAPDYTRTCSCAYQNQTSLALVSMPEIEMWTYSAAGLDTPGDKRVVRAGINLGAPGDRLADDGTLWLEYPIVGGMSPPLPVTITPASAPAFRRHASAVTGQGPPWVVASGLRDVESVVVTPQTSKDTSLSKSSERRGKSVSDREHSSPDKSKTGSAGANSSLAPARYTVRLFFLEPDRIRPGERVFDVLLQGRTVVNALDIVRIAGGIGRSLMSEFKGVTLDPRLEVRLRKTPGSPLGPVLSGIEMILEPAGSRTPQDRRH